MGQIEEFCKDTGIVDTRAFTLIRLGGESCRLMCYVGYACRVVKVSRLKSRNG